MTVSSKTLRLLHELGVTGDALVTLVESIEQDMQPITFDLTGAERQKRYRDRLGVSKTTWDILRNQVFERDNYRCKYCQEYVYDSPQCDHIVPLILGGTNDIENLTTSCKRCNSSKAGKLWA